MEKLTLRNLEQLREDAGLSRAQLAARTQGKVSTSTIARAEARTAILRLKALQLSKALGVQLEQLIGAYLFF